MNKEKSINNQKIAEFYSRYGILVVFVLVFIVASLASNRFLSGDNLISVLNQTAIVGVLSCGMTMLVISGNTDLAAGSTIAFSGVFAAILISKGLPVWLTIILTLIIGAVAYGVPGTLVSYIGLPSFIVTLAMQMAFRGIAQVMCGGTPIFNVGSLSVIGQSKFLGIPLPVWILLALVIIFSFILTSTSFGRYLYAIGGNKEAAVAAGIYAKKTILYSYLIMGAITSLAGLILAARTNSGQPAAGEGYEFDAIIACVLGGTSLSGGVGNVASGIIGALVIGIINNCMNLVGISAYYQKIVKGLIILIAILVDKKTRDAIMKA